VLPQKIFENRCESEQFEDIGSSKMGRENRCFSVLFKSGTEFPAPHGQRRRALKNWDGKLKFSDKVDRQLQISDRVLVDYGCSSVVAINSPQ